MNGACGPFGFSLADSEGNAAPTFVKLEVLGDGTFTISVDGQDITADYHPLKTIELSLNVYLSNYQA